jgi:hypothetical protein
MTAAAAALTTCATAARSEPSEVIRTIPVPGSLVAVSELTSSKMFASSVCASWLRNDRDSTVSTITGISKLTRSMLPVSAAFGVTARVEVDTNDGPPLVTAR